MQIKQLKPEEKRYMVRDDRGLYIEIMPSGNKHWRLRYWENGKERKLDLGQYPGVGLREARNKRDEINLNREKGISPREEKKHIPTFEEVSREWYERKIAPSTVNAPQPIIFEYSKGDKKIKLTVPAGTPKEEMRDAIAEAVRAVSGEASPDSVPTQTSQLATDGEDVNS